MKKPIQQGVGREALIAALLTAWEAEGNMVGTDKYIEVNSLLNKLPQDYKLAQLKTILTPILTNNAQQQNDFYRLFDNILKSTIENAIDHSEAVEQEKNRFYWQRTKFKAAQSVNKTVSYFKGNFVRTILLGIICLLVTGVIWQILYFRRHYDDMHASSKIGELKKVCIKLQKGDNITRIAQKTGVARIVNAGTYFSDFCISYQAFSVGRDTILCFVESQNGHSEVVNISVQSLFSLKLTPPQVVSDTSSINKNKTLASLKEKDNMMLAPQNFLQDSSKTEEINGQYVDNYSSSWEFGFGNAYFSIEKALIVLASLILVLMIGYYYHYRNQKFTLTPQVDRDTLYNWTIKIPNYGSVGMDADYYVALSEMRKRHTDESRRVDIHKTVHATIENAGMIDFRYKSQFLTKNYLVFIDKTNPLSISTLLNEYLINSLISNEAPIEIFFFSNGSLSCWNDKYKNGIKFQDIQHKYGDAQIIIFSDGKTFIDIANHTLKSEYSVLTQWRKRVLLTPIPVSQWGQNEEILNQKLRILPASTYGLSQIVETLEAVEVKSLGILKKDFLKKEKLITAPSNADSDFLNTLQNQLISTKLGRKDDRLMQWVAACALPPIPFWDWTLYVGGTLSENGENFLNIENLSIISQLKWLREGKIPDDMRSILLKWLEKEHPFWYLKILQEWEQVLKLENNLPPRGSIQWYGHRIQLLLTELLQNPKQKERRRLEIELDNLLAEDLVNDAMVMQYLSKRKSPMDNVLSDRFRKFIQIRKNLFWRWRDWTWQTPSVLGVLLGTLFISYTEPVTTFNFGENIYALAFSPDSKSFLAASGKGKVSICDINSHTMQGVKTQKNIVHLGATENENKLIISAASTEGAIMNWQESGNTISSVLSKGGITAITQYPNTSKILVGYYMNNAAILFDLSKKNTDNVVFQHDEAITDVTFSKDGSMILTASRDNTAKLWASNGTLLKTFQHNNVVHSVDISPDGTKILTGCRDNTAQLWDVNGSLLHTLIGHDYDVFDVHFSPNGQMLLTASGDKTAKVWSLEGNLLRTLRGHLNYVNQAAFSPDNTKVATGDSDGKVKLWTLTK